MIAAGPAKGNCDLRFYDAPLPLVKGEAGLVKHERTIL